MQEIGQIGEEAVRRIIRTVQECSEVVKYHRKQASRQKISDRKQRNVNRSNVFYRSNINKGDIFYRRNTASIEVYKPNPIFVHETDQN
ncbi:MAG TPA: hypothetical protein PKU83_04575 [Chryseolinea sp.]|nr:hypothetical protein [Chryseolinea sp.]